MSFTTAILAILAIGALIGIACSITRIVVRHRKLVAADRVSNFVLHNDAGAAK